MYPSAWTDTQPSSATLGVWRGAQKDLREQRLQKQNTKIMIKTLYPNAGP